MNTQLAIQERDLELVVSEKTLGSLTTNAKQNPRYCNGEFAKV